MNNYKLKHLAKFCCKPASEIEFEAKKLDDDRVVFQYVTGDDGSWKWSDDSKSLVALNGHYFKTNDDGTEVTLHKRESC
jgi:hypothetical protein